MRRPDKQEGRRGSGDLPELQVEPATEAAGAHDTARSYDEALIAGAYWRSLRRWSDMVRSERGWVREYEKAGVL